MASDNCGIEACEAELKSSIQIIFGFLTIINATPQSNLYSDWPVAKDKKIQKICHRLIKNFVQVTTVQRTALKLLI